MDDSGSKKTRTRRSHGYSVFKRKDSRWEYAVVVGYNENGNPKRIRGYCATRAEAVQEAQKLVVKRDAGGYVPISENPTVADWIDHWLTEVVKPNLAPKTFAYYSGFCKHHIVPAIGKVKLREVTPERVQKLLNEGLKKGLAPSSVRGLRATLRAAMSEAWRGSYVENNPVERTRPPKVEKKDPEHLSVAEGKKLIEASERHPLGNLFVFALFTGARIGEATGLRWENVDFERKTVRFVAQLQRIESKLVLKGLKSKSSRRTLALPSQAFKALQDQRTGQMVALSIYGEGLNPEGYVFTTDDGRPLDPKTVNDNLKALLKRAGIKEVSFHTLRHTAATMLVAAGVPLNQVKEQLGHSQVALTADLYAHAIDEGKIKAAETLGRVFGD